MNGKEIMMGAQLTVRESQVAVFVNEGQIADVFTPGRYELETSNMPVMTALKSWSYGFKSPFKADVYFINTKQFTDCRWGTSNPIMKRDPELIKKVYTSYKKNKKVCNNISKFPHKLQR